jgi:glutamyl-tRNA synthetase
MSNSNREIRVRFAPSPTGALHIGGVRTALFNYLFAKKNGGKLILRIEDTDQTRFVPGAEEYIIEALNWCGISIDEAPNVSGPYSPYRQSERKDMYGQYALDLIDSGNAYYAFDTSEELEKMRERLKAARIPNPQYNSVTRETMRNSLTLPTDEVKKLLGSKVPYVIRTKIPRKEEIRINDMVRGWVMVHSESLDDKVLLKSDGMPTYHLANVVDDHLMKITHVIRGEEWLPSAPLHMLLYQFFGWEDTAPQFAHLPLILKPDGNGKLSKRDGDKLGFPVFPLNWEDPKTGERSSGFREKGFFPEAVINFLALLGWSPGNNQEIFSMEELIEAFSIERIGKAGTKFDYDKAKWFNQHYLREQSPGSLLASLKANLNSKGLSYDEAKLKDIIDLLRERAIFPDDLFEQGEFFFKKPEEFDEKVIRKKWNEKSSGILKSFSSKLENIDPWIMDNIKDSLEKSADGFESSPGSVMQLLRVCLTGKPAGADLMKTLEILGKNEVTSRLNYALENLKKEQ